MREMRKRLIQTEKLYYNYQKERLFTGIVQFYCETIKIFSINLSGINLKSRGFIAFREYLNEYVRSEYFTFLVSEIESITHKLFSIKYCLNLKDLQVQVRACDSEIDYTSEIETVFEKFRQGEVKDYRIKFPEMLNMNDVEAKILDRVAQLHPDTFLQLDNFCEKYRNFQNETIAVFDREIQFYIAYLEYITPLKKLN